jgi:cation diffusion facilitator family transporter
MKQQAVQKSPIPPGRFLWLSVAASIVTVALKFAAYRVTDSVGLLSDAVESTANVFAACTAVFALWYSSRPADPDHPYGHEKIEFFSSGIEGGLIGLASITIGITAIGRLNHPEPPESVGLGLFLVAISTLINFVVGRTLLKVGKSIDSIVLEADGHHLMTDVWTSIFVGIGVFLASVTQIGWIDPVLAILVAINIARIGYDLMRRSFNGLMDRALEDNEVLSIRGAIESTLGADMTYHALRTRRAGAQRFVDYHLLVPGNCTVSDAHGREMLIGQAIQRAVPGIEITAHIEPIEEPLAWNDSRLEDVISPDEAHNAISS